MEMNNHTMNMTESNMADEYPLGMAIASIFMSLFGVFGNALIIIATMIVKPLQHRCNYLIATLALADMITSAYFVQMRIIFIMGGLYWTNVKCFLWSAHGLIALNVQSGMGLVLGVDRLLAIVQPLRYIKWESKKYLTCSIVPVIFYSMAITGYGWTQTTYNATVAICLPPAAFYGRGRMVWITSNILIVLLVLITYGTAQYKIRRANDSCHREESVIMGKRLLTSLSCVMVVYTATWALTVVGMFVNQTLLPPAIAQRVQLQFGWLVIINTSSNVIIYTWRGGAYRKAFVKIITCGIYYYDNRFKRRNAIIPLKSGHCMERNSAGTVRQQSRRVARISMRT